MENNSPEEFRKKIEMFRDFLNASWPTIMKASYYWDWDADPYVLDDWIQANWELIVERQLGGNYVLPSYGFDGSPRCRYSNKTRLSNHEIIAVDLESEDFMEYRFLSFCARKETSYRIEPPFDCVNLEEIGNRKRFVRRLSSVELQLRAKPAPE